MDESTPEGKPQLPGLKLLNIWFTFLAGHKKSLLQKLAVV